jgi:hypothetical protein
MPLGEGGVIKDMSSTHSKVTARQRILTACIAAACAVAIPDAVAVPRTTGTTAAPSPDVPNVTVTNCDDSGPGSLRDALSNPPDGTLVDLTQLTCSTISLTTGAILIGANDIAIVGPGRFDLTIDASPSAGAAAIYDLGGGTLHLANMTIEGGSKYRSDVAARGGCVHTEANVQIENSTIRNCYAGSPYGALGGGVFAGGLAYLRNTTLYGNHASSTWYASGGGLYSLGGLQLMYSTVETNFVVGLSSTPSFGGGAFARGGAFVMGSTIDDNLSVNGRMGGLALADNNATPSIIVNSTISGNFADRIGGLFVREPVTIANSTIAFNTSNVWSDGAGHYLGAGVYIQTGGELDSTIIANNVNNDPAAPTPTADLTGASGAGFIGGHNNVMFAGAPCPVDTSHDDPGLHPLADNGGFTKTHIPTPGIWDTFGGTNTLNMQWDQRGPGFPRQSTGDFPEIGAVQISSDLIFANGFN